MPENRNKDNEKSNNGYIESNGSIYKKDIAIIGMSAILPKANSINDFWENIKNGLECTNELPIIRKRDIENYLKYTKYDTKQIKYKKVVYIDEIDKFDYNFFKISPKEARLMDPNQRLFLESAWSTMEDAGYSSEKLFGTRTGVYVGFRSYKQVYPKMIEEVEPLSKKLSFSGNIAAVIPSRVAYHLNLLGPSILIDTACSSTLVAVHLACRAIRDGDCEYAIAGGITLEELPIDKMDGFGIESSDGKTRTFDNGAEGTIEGEGVASILLKPLQKALEDKDNIYAIIKGSAVNNDGRSLGITAPNASAQEDVIVKAWVDAGIEPETISYIEAHGTATKLGDPTEILGIKKAFERYTNRKQFCAIGSVKSNIGHLNAVAGLAGLIKTVMALKYKQIPPTLHFNRPNKRISFYKSPVYINDSLIEWKTEGKRRCGVSSFGISGTNCHVVLEEAPEDFKIYKNEKDDDKLQVLAISANSKNSLKQLIADYDRYLSNKNDNYELKNICFTANTGRGHYNYRLAIIVRTIEGLKEKISKLTKSGMGLFSNKTYMTDFFYNENKPQKKDDSEILPDTLFGDIKYADLKNRVENIGVLEELCRYYVNGGKVNWKLIYSGLNVKRVSIPTYAFEKKRCWLKIDDCYDLDKVNSFESMFNIAFWEEKDLAQNIAYSENGIILVLNNKNTIGKQIVKKLRDNGNEVIEVNIGECFRKLSNNEFYISNSIEDMQSLFNEIELNKLVQIIHLCSIFYYNRQIKDEYQWDEKLKYGLYNFFYLMKGIKDLKRKLDIVVISEYSYEVTKNEDIIIPENAALIGLGKVVAWEFPGIKCRCIDIDSNTSIENIAEEIKTGYRDYLVAYRNGHRYIELIKNINIFEEISNKLEYKENGAYVITGGTGGIGLEISRFLALKCKVKLALISRTNIYDINNKNSLEHDKYTRKHEKIKEIERLGATVKLYTGDVSDKSDMEKILDQVRCEFGSINGILHIAGINKGGTIYAQSLDEFNDILLSKIHGTRIFHDLTTKDDLDFFILFSSAMTLVGGKGTGGYTAANSYLDSFSAYRSKLGKGTLTINWPTWDGTGFSEGRPNDSKEIFKVLDPNNALAILEKSINTNHNRLIIGEFNSDSKLYDILKYLPFRFSEELESVILSKRNENVGSVFHRERKAVSKVDIESYENNKISDIERRVAQVWGRVLGYEKLNINDNYFELGGDSIFSVKIEVELENDGLLDITYTDIYKYPTIKELALHIEGKKSPLKKRARAAKLQSENIENIAKIIKGSFEPFNEIFFKGDCFYNTFIPIVRTYNKSIIPFLFTDIIKYSYCLSDKGESDIEYIPIYDTVRLFSDMGLLVETKLKSDDVVEDIKQAINMENPVLLWIDSYYESIRKDVFEKYHLPHTILILGYDNDQQLFLIIEHEDRDSLSYKRRTIGFVDIRKCYDGYLNMFSFEKKSPSYFEFNVDNHRPKNEDYVGMLNSTIYRFASSMVEEQEEIMDALKHIIELADELKTYIIGGTANYNIEKFVSRLNKIIIARQSENYRIGKILPINEHLSELLSNIIEYWIIVRAKLARCIYTSTYTKEDLYTCVDTIYQIYDFEHNYHKGLFNLLNNEIKKYRK